MAHEITTIDRVGLRGEQAWHKLGVLVDDNLTAVEAGTRFGMFWPIGRWALEAIGPNGQRIAVDSHVANVRLADADGQSIEHLLGVVGADYQVCQNQELAEFTDALAQSGKVVIESCGSIRGGKRVWFLARGSEFQIGGTDRVWPYLLVSNGHDGTQSIRVTPTTIRVVCSNTLHMVIPATDFAGRPDSAAIAIRHCGKISDKLQQARQALAYYGQTLARNVELFEAMQARQISRDSAVKLFAETYATHWAAPTDDELRSGDKKVRRTAELRAERMAKASAAFMDRWNSEKSKLALGDTVWSAFNALTGFLQHDYKARGTDDANRVERRRESNLFGLNAARTHEALAASLAIAG